MNVCILIDCSQLFKTYYNVLFGSFTRDRYARRRIYLRTFSSLNASCMTISGERTEQLDTFCRITGFTSDFLSFIDVELIWFFHGALQLSKLVHACRNYSLPQLVCFYWDSVATKHSTAKCIQLAKCTNELKHTDCGSAAANAQSAQSW